MNLGLRTAAPDDGIPGNITNQQSVTASARTAARRVGCDCDDGDDGDGGDGNDGGDGCDDGDGGDDDGGGGDD
eukprot:3601667-Alexandrium_andersonii.AAC.1